EIRKTSPGPSAKSASESFTDDAVRVFQRLSRAPPLASPAARTLASADLSTLATAGAIRAGPWTDCCGATELAQAVRNISQPKQVSPSTARNVPNILSIRNLGPQKQS